MTTTLAETRQAMLILPATLTSREARDTQRMLTQALRQQGPTKEAAAGDSIPEVTVDASGLQRFDSAALAVLIECHRLAQAQGRGFAVRQAPPKLVELAGLYGVDGLLGLAATAAVTA
jgi:phospholipid transport system transporter-binding protein